MTNDNVYLLTQVKKWGKIVIKRRLKWFSKIVTAKNDTPMRKAFDYATSHYQRPRGKPTTTWLSVVKNDFKSLNISWDDAIEFAKDTKEWNTIINRL